MSATRDGKGTREVPPELRQAVARAIESEIAAKYRGKSERAIAKAFGLSQSALNKLRHAEGALGLNALLELRKALHLSLDALLGLPDLDAREPTPVPPPSKLSPEALDQIRELLQNELPRLPKSTRPPKPRESWKPTEKRR